MKLPVNRNSGVLALAMVLYLEPAAVLIGFGVVLVTTTVRGAMGAFAPVPGQ